MVTLLQAEARDPGIEMNKGMLAQHFKGIAFKRLSAVEADTHASNQHEFNGVGELKKIFGSERRQMKTKFIWIGDEQEAVPDDGYLTWYDARAAHPSRSEYRLYFPTTAVSELAKAGDALFIALRTDGTALVVVTPAESTIKNQLVWLFGLPDQPELQFAAQAVSGDESAKLDFAVRLIFDELGIEAEEPESDILDGVLEKFGKQFPKTSEFSDLARSTLPYVSAFDDADAALMAWLEREEFLFKRLERHILADRIKSGFMSDGEADVENFIQVSLSVQNRRKARAGAALENHLEYIFSQRKILVGRNCVTELNNKPDFLFPGCEYYNDASFPELHLTMLAAKSSAKERWRQILHEAHRVKEKHLLTLSPGISVNQTNQMKSEGLRLVIPAALHQTFQPEQQHSLMNLMQFLKLVSERQMNL